MNSTYDNYHRRLRKFRISIQVLMILSVCVLTALSIFRIYMLNGFETQWPFQKATKYYVQFEEKSSFRPHGISYSYEADGKSYDGFQPIAKKKVQDPSTYQIYYNSRYPRFNYVSSYNLVKLSAIKTLTILFDCLLLYLFLLPYLHRIIPTATEIRDRRWKEKYGTEKKIQSIENRVTISVSAVGIVEVWELGHELIDRWSFLAFISDSRLHMFLLPNPM